MLLNLTIALRLAKILIWLAALAVSAVGLLLVRLLFGVPATLGQFALALCLILVGLLALKRLALWAVGKLLLWLVSALIRAAIKIAAHLLPVPLLWSVLGAVRKAAQDPQMRAAARAILEDEFNRRTRAARKDP